MEQGPNPNRERKVNLVQPRTIPGEVVDNHEDQREGEYWSDLRKEKRRKLASKSAGILMSSGVTMTYTIIKYLVGEGDRFWEKSDSENPVSDEEHRAE